jgi:hypothetical protein
MRILPCLSVWICLFVGVSTLHAQAPHHTVDNSIFADLLAKYVSDGRVDYHGFKSEEKRLDAYLKVLETTNTKTLDRNEQFAFYINAYNAWTIKLILSGYPGIHSIWDLGGRFFDKPFGKKIVHLDGRIMSLDDIENRILRPRFKDPRVHMAINCASKSCPALSSEPYEGSRLDEQLNERARLFINDPSRNYLKGHTLYVSKIFKWSSKDFHGDIIDFFIRFANEPLKTKLIRNRDRIRLRYLDYDWSLNGK